MALFTPRRIALVFAVVFLLGAGAGSLVTNALHDVKLSHFFNSTADPKSMAERINQKYERDYDLSANEQFRIAPLTREMTERLYLTRRQFGVDILATLDDYHGRIGREMTPEHRAAYAKANEERHKRMGAMLLLDPPADVPEQK